ncbi:DUF4352 domain-containing protein [Rhodococcus sp. IEGM 1401]|uniref:DUF4352 domain-containing protein n=1 Tax=unclassified Rhodococcus (in: high G+C Gram-positive bacteria) TaxID=192944 RepID=UPI0022B2DFD0|nr:MULTISPECIES: DUF4352 domain-containing protein [unclassified Rhodococcus (in: high G+C Gram-positive bacteria)]MCZ4563372.1 DUF4352 domain-containing protein [Rhodococcus sp. IEGM 1401]MDI9923495.1 DUF4352 domain-containing protein [Rhodococcus sp. IEGM 1372]MDV8035985.1 DUF4352 domain-containing protein [Rhodococcus sp. IEGM 1414]
MTNHNPNPQQQYAPPAPEQKKSWFARHKILTVILAIVVLGVLIRLIGGGSSESPTAPAPAGSSASEEAAPAAPAEPAQPGIGVAVRDGKFEFIVTAVAPPVTTVGSEYLTQTAQGEYVQVTMTVRNIGDRAQSLDASSQKLLDADGKQYSVDSLATAYLDEGIGYEQINPGNALDTTVVFDVPVGTVPAEIELHDSAFSGGTAVALR